MPCLRSTRRRDGVGDRRREARDLLAFERQRIDEVERYGDRGGSVAGAGARRSESVNVTWGSPSGTTRPGTVTRAAGRYLLNGES
jgi:hypothetical protein